MVAKGEEERGGEGKDWEFGISRCKLLYREWINTRSYCIAQGTIFNILVKNHKGKKYEKEYVEFPSWRSG